MLVISYILLSAALVFAVIGLINNAPKFNSIAIICLVVETIIGIGGKLAT